jgi:DNA-directed RNA polymerase
MKDDVDHSRERWLKQEQLRANLTGLGLNHEGHAIRRKYRGQLKRQLDADRRQRRNMEIWRALKDAGLVGIDIRTDQFVDRLLGMGLTAAADERVGVDDDGIKKLRGQALWLGQHLGLSRSQRVLEFKVGAWAIDQLRTLPVFALDEDRVLTLRLTTGLYEWLKSVVEDGVRSNAFFFPSAEPPEPWTQVSKGGLSPSNDWARVSLISGHRRYAEDAVRNAIARGKMQPVLDAINSLAGTAFTINKRVLDFMRRREEPRIQELIAKADALAREHELRERDGLKVKWSERKELANLRADLSVWTLDMAAAEILTGRERFYVPLQIDFRGRINPIPFFNFTRSDPIRALFLFDRDEPIGEEGLRYLKSHVAGCADGNRWSTIERPGNLDFAGRVAWTEDNRGTLLKVGKAVFHGDGPAQWEWVLETIGDPYQFVAACLELAQADEEPSFKTRLPIVFVATCSGLQHICAMMRAEEGRHVNLVPSNELSDFYSLVGAAVYRKAYDKIPEYLRGVEHKPDGTIVSKFNQIPDEELGLLRLFKDGNPFDRKIIKRPGMTYGYGSRPGGWQKTKRGRYRPKGMTEQIVEVLKEREQSPKDAHKLAKAAYDVIEEMMPAAKTLRNFLEKIAKLYTKHNKVVMHWETLLPVRNAYYEPIIETIPVKIDGKRRRTNLVTGDTDDIDSTANTSVTANFIHSSDACHLHMVANATAKEAIPSVTIHDCWGFLAPHAKRGNERLREQFVQLHEGYNWLEQILDSAKRDLPKAVHDKLPKLPARGSLNLAGVLKSFFAFK